MENASKPLISVIIPAYNSEKTVERAVSSALHQSYGRIEVVVVDDGSADNTAAIVEEMKAKDSRIRLIKKANAGVSAARNDGLRLASGEYFITLDADDYMDPEMAERLYDTVSYSGADLVMCGFRMVWPNGRKTAFALEESYVDDLEDFTDAVFVKLYDRHMISTHSNKLYSMNLLRKYHIYYNERLAVNEDIDFVLRYLRYCSTVGVIKGVYLNYVQNQTGKSLNTTFQPYGISSSLLVLRDCERLFNEIEPEAEVVQAMNNRMLMHICSFVGLMYYRSGYSEEEKLAALEKLAAREEFQQLLEDTIPSSLKNFVACFLLKHGFTKQYHFLCKLLYIGKKKIEAGSISPENDGYELLDSREEPGAFVTDPMTGIDTELIRTVVSHGGTQHKTEDSFRVTDEDLAEIQRLLEEAAETAEPAATNAAEPVDAAETAKSASADAAEAVDNTETEETVKAAESAGTEETAEAGEGKEEKKTNKQETCPKKDAKW